MSSYFNQSKVKNKDGLVRVMNGMTDVDHITGLQVTGVSQLTKEIQETRALKNKKIDT